MTSPGGLLDFFTLEASEYVEQIDGLLAKAGASGPDADALLRNARALRGSATMAKLPAIADLATQMERVTRGLLDAAVAWEPALSGAMIAAVDDLKLLVRAVRNWSPSDNQRATTRSAELARYAPQRARGATPTSTSGTTFFSAEASNIAAGLELLLARSDDRDAAANVLRRVRALRGVAGIKDVGPLSEVMEAAELVMKPLELGEGEMSEKGLTVLRTGAELLRRVSAALRSGSAPDEPSPERDHFRAAVEAFRGPAGQAEERIVPISELFFADGGPTVVSTAPNPPTTPAERFRLEMVSQGEHLQRLVADGRDAKDEMSRDRVRRELTHALMALRAAAESFGEQEVSKLISGHVEAVEKLDYLALSSLDALASVIARPGAHGERLAARLAELRTGEALDSGIGAALIGHEPTPSSTDARLSTVLGAAPAAPAAPMMAPTPSSAPTPIVNPRVPSAREAFAPPAPVQPPAQPPVEPRPAAAATATSTAPQHRRSAEDLMAALDQSITGFASLAEQPLSPPKPLDIPVVPIDALLYRGRAAIERALVIRDEVRRAGGAPPRESLDELFDLLELALAE